MTSSTLDAAAASARPGGLVGRRTGGRALSVKVNLGGRTNLGLEVVPDSDGRELLVGVSDGARVDSVIAGREVARENGNDRRDGTTDAGVVLDTDDSTNGRRGAGRRKDEVERAVVDVTVSIVSSVVFSSSVTATGGGVVGRPNRGVTELLLAKTLLLATIELLAKPVEVARTPLLKRDGRLAANGPRLLRPEPIDGTKLLLENRRPGRLEEDEDKTGVGLIPLLEGDDGNEDLRRKNWLRDEDSVKVALATT